VIGFADRELSNTQDALGFLFVSAGLYLLVNGACRGFQRCSKDEPPRHGILPPLLGRIGGKPGRVALPDKGSSAAKEAIRLERRLRHRRGLHGRRRNGS